MRLLHNFNGRWSAFGLFVAGCLGMIALRGIGRSQDAGKAIDERSVPVPGAPGVIQRTVRQEGAQPAVMDLNMRAASFGMMVLRHLLQPFLLPPLPVMILENLVTYSVKTIREARTVNPKCPVCQVNRRAGYGDCAPQLGLEKNALLAIVGERHE